MQCWELIADNLSKAGWSWGCVSGVDLSFISWSFGRSVAISAPSAAEQ
jgi:hypothetical protein